jgi:CHAT domain-containing protein
MERAELAERLAEADDAERAALLKQPTLQLDVELAYALKELCYTAWASDPARTVSAAHALAALAQHLPQPEVRALADWTTGIAALTTGQMEAALDRLDQAAAGFEGLGKPHTAASTQVSKLIALAMLGHYDEALACGLHARDVFVAHGDELAAGKIEQNLGNLYFRRDRYAEAEHLYRSARKRFATVGHANQLVQIDVCLAVTLASQHRFREAAQLYPAALARAEAAGLEVTQAEIECNIGCLALFQGQYDRALDYLERSRRRYVALDMPHESAIAELELADAYLELNLAPEAAAIYGRIIPTFAELGLRAEQARALAHHGRAHLLLGQIEPARAALAEARALYVAEANPVGEAVVSLTEAQLHYAAGHYAEAVWVAAQADAPLAEAGAWGRSLLARWLCGEAARALGQAREARRILEAALREADQHVAPQVTQRCHTSLGLLAATAGNAVEAEASFKQAIAIIEDLRAPLPAEEFRTAFVADKLTPYAELARLCLDDGRPERVAEALGYVERARSRALVDMLGGALTARLKPDDPFEAELVRRLETLREELNWFYSQINHPRDSLASRSAAVMASLHEAAREREAAVLEITRQLRQRGHSPLVRVEPLDLALLQRELGEDTALVEYFSLDGELLAFVVTNERVEVVRQLGSEAEAEAALHQLHFQMEALRYGPGRVSQHLDQLAARARRHLNALYAMLLEPLEPRLGTRRLVVVPHRSLHYVPFHALHDGRRYVIERREVSYAPSAGVLRYCFARPAHPWHRAVLLGLPDTYTPRVREELATLTPLFSQAVTLLDEDATLAALQAHAPTADVIHLACHGHFRPDNPLFSALRLSDGWLTVREAYGLDLRQCGLVVLSACETGVSALAPGDDLIGLARGFFSAGAASLVVSLWTVDDEVTAQLMAQFYARLRAGDAPAAALRFAQCRVLGDHPHPFFWSPFVLLGRW